MENNNINTNVAQIILPPDMELRKIKKKKPKTSSEKKKVLNELKETLKEFDTALSVAGSKKINIPAEIGILPNNINEINSIKELKQLIATLKERIQIINQLVAQGATKERGTGLFNEGMGSGQRLPSTPGQFAPQQPQILPAQQILPNQIQPIPSQGNPSQIPDSDAEESLDKLREELLNKLNPEDKAKAEAQLEEERQAQKDSNEEEQGDISIPVDDSQEAPELETDLGFDIGGGKRIDLKSPKGWTTIYGNYRKYVEKLTAKLIKIDDGIFEITPLELKQLNESKNDILDQHDDFIKLLVNQSQLKYMDSDPNLKQLDTNMINNLTLDPISLIKEIAKEQKVEIKEITSGETSSETKLKDKRTEKVKKLLTKIEIEENSYALIIKEANEAKQANNKDELKQLAKEVQDDNNAITVLRDELTGTEQVSMEAEYQSFKVKAAMLERNLVRMQNEDIRLGSVGNVVSVTKGTPKPVDADIPLKKPTRPDEEGDISPVDQQRINILIAYYKNVGKNWSTQEKNAYLQLFNEIELANINKKKGRSKKLPVIKRMIQQKFPSIPDSEFIMTASF